MDPKQPAQLDPKLKEAYDRVMGTATPPVASPTTPQPPVPVATPNPAVTLPPTQSTSAAPTTQPAAPTPAEPPLTVAPVVMPHSTETVRIGGATPIEVQHTTTGVVVKGTKKGISPVIIALGAIVFLVVYSLFWIKFLNVPVPFINQ